jgi:hypothetical protein
MKGRRCSPVSAIQITEKLLLKAGGWQAMKPARELLKGGRVSDAKYEPPLLSGYVREGGKNYRSDLRITPALGRIFRANRASKNLPRWRPAVAIRDSRIWPGGWKSSNASGQRRNR